MLLLATPGIFRPFHEPAARPLPPPPLRGILCQPLCITQKYLSTIVKEISDRTPSQWIRDTLINEIAYQLAHTSCSIKEIAYDFNFPTISFFGKYFKSATGLSPKKYRLSLSEA